MAFDRQAEGFRIDALWAVRTGAEKGGEDLDGEEQMSLIERLDELRLRTQQFPHDKVLEDRWIDELDCAYPALARLEGVKL
jgi:hypothetical protein